LHALKVTTLLGDVEAKSSVQQLSPEQLAELKQRASTQGSAVKDAKTVRAVYWSGNGQQLVFVPAQAPALQYGSTAPTHEPVIRTSSPLDSMKCAVRRHVRCNGQLSALPLI